jgi:hypothetical protein
MGSSIFNREKKIHVDLFPNNLVVNIHKDTNNFFLILIKILMGHKFGSSCTIIALY